ncbi:multicopper oxidase family protein [Dongia sp.]|uniref:multicopper oxidase family protein n=1 Tax=Dongia sp. TaxID=1977262 RepID=UPI003750A888
MNQNFSRRRFLASTATLAAGLGLAGLPARAETGQALRAVRRSIEVNGKAASVFGLVGPDGRPGLALDPSQRFKLALANEIDEALIVHWHGQTPSPDQDGVTDTGYVQPIAAGARQAYDFAPRSGTHWMHSHHGLQEQNLMAAPLIVRTEDDRRRDAQEVVVLLHDFSFRDPAEILAGLTGGSGMAMDHGTMDHGSMSSMPGMDMGGGGMTGMDLNDVAYDAFLANDRTLADPEIFQVERAGRVHLRLINGATSTAFWIDLGALSGTVIATDGNPVKPVEGRRFPMAQGQRLDLLIELKEAGAFPILAQREGDAARTGFILATPGAAIAKLADQAEQAAAPIDNLLEARLVAASPLAAKPVDVTHRLNLTGGMMPYQWSFDGRTWKDHLPLAVKPGQRVAVELVNQSMMAHPMHLHGHHFQVTALNGKPLSGAVRDTVLVPVQGSVTLAFDADNPGRWLFHCHNLYHMATGMMTEVAYANA